MVECWVEENERVASGQRATWLARELPGSWRASAWRGCRHEGNRSHFFFLLLWIQFDGPSEIKNTLSYLHNPPMVRARVAAGTGQTHLASKAAWGTLAQPDVPESWDQCARLLSYARTGREQAGVE